ncbi:MAG: hypothetical protein LBI04_01090 [Treponema sp.]|jgi:hypothetical protein|nr:hypothetical protein [Treponema sp.]
MAIEQTVEIPPNRRLFVDVPPEVPVGKVILTFTPAAARKDLEYAKNLWAANHGHPEELKVKLENLHGSVGENAFGGLDGVAYQHKVRSEWDG